MKLLKNPINKIDPNNPLDLEIWVLTEGVELPKKGNYYVIADDGYWLHKEMGLVHGFVKLKGFGLVKPMQASVGIRIPMIPEIVTWKARNFFNAVYQKNKCESILFLVYSEDKKAFGLVCPPQTAIGYSRLKYDPKQIYLDDELVIVGTIHSHCDFGSSHSGEDQHDEAQFDGLHVTIGHVNSDNFSMTASIVVNDNRVEVDPCKYFKNLIKSKGRYKIDVTEQQDRALNRRYSGTIAEWMKKISVKPLLCLPKDNGRIETQIRFHEKNTQGAE